MKVKKSQRNGFTLIEMLVVISIIVLLASVLYPAVDAALRRGRQTQCMANLRNFGIAWNAFYLETMATTRDHDMAAVYPWLSAMYPEAVTDLRLFVCPSDRSRGRHGSKPVEDPSYGMTLARLGGYDPNDFPETDDNQSNPASGDHARRNPDVRANSYMYEFCDATISWNWQGYILNGEGGFATPAQVDLEPDGRITWGEVKMAQLAWGDTNSFAGYDRTRFPLVRCFHHYSDKPIRVRNLDNPNSSFVQRTARVLNLAVAGNVFLSGLQWEYPEVP